MLASDAHLPLCHWTIAANDTTISCCQFVNPWLSTAAAGARMALKQGGADIADAIKAAADIDEDKADLASDRIRFMNGVHKRLCRPVISDRIVQRLLFLGLWRPCRLSVTTSLRSRHTAMTSTPSVALVICTAGLQAGVLHHISAVLATPRSGAPGGRGSVGDNAAEHGCG